MKLRADYLKRETNLTNLLVRLKKEKKRGFQIKSNERDVNN